MIPGKATGFVSAILRLLHELSPNLESRSGILCAQDWCCFVTFKVKVSHPPDLRFAPNSV